MLSNFMKYAFPGIILSTGVAVILFSKDLTLTKMKVYVALYGITACMFSFMLGMLSNMLDTTRKDLITVREREIRMLKTLKNVLEKEKKIGDAITRVDIVSGVHSIVFGVNVDEEGNFINEKNKKEEK